MPPTVVESPRGVRRGMDPCSRTFGCNERSEVLGSRWRVPSGQEGLRACPTTGETRGTSGRSSEQLELIKKPPLAEPWSP